LGVEPWSVVWKRKERPSDHLPARLPEGTLPSVFSPEAIHPWGGEAPQKKTLYRYQIMLGSVRKSKRGAACGVKKKKKSRFEWGRPGGSTPIDHNQSEKNRGEPCNVVLQSLGTLRENKHKNPRDKDLWRKKKKGHVAHGNRQKKRKSSN